MSPRLSWSEIVIRPAVVAVIVAIVLIIIRLTPFPDINNTHANCDRPCHELEWPMICRFQFIIESRRSLTRKSCDHCWKNASDCAGKKYCFIGDGSDRRIFTVNRLFPGPSLHVCENDILVVEVVNRLVGHSVTLHWRGQPLQETPAMDGVPMVTQCPVSPHTTFQYKLRASQPGTHFWQAMTGDTEMDDLFGALIVRRSAKLEPHRTLYDEDNHEHLIYLSEWTSRSGQSTLLINGMSAGKEGNFFPLQTYNVTKGKRYRFRVAYTTSHSGCPVSAQISSHSLLILALDGQPTEPKKVDSIHLVPGERIDFVLSADQAINRYTIRFKTSDWCSDLNVENFAILMYNSSHPSSKIITKASQSTVLTTVQDTGCGGHVTHCLSNLKSLEKLPDKLSGGKTDVSLTFELQERNYSGDQTFEFDELDLRQGRSLNGITFTFPSSPLLLRPSDDSLDENPDCNDQKMPATCVSEEISNFCGCTHIISIPLMASVQIIILNPGANHLSSEKSNPNFFFHLHGQHFYLIQRRELAEFANLSESHLRSTNPNITNSVLKDTISIPPKSFTILRFIASNPGYWFFHEGRSQLWSRGMAVVLKVGQRDDFPDVPETFPSCGNWIGPEFFLA
nr:PREDICTED: laccase-25-like [Bemisia tabaci]